MRIASVIAALALPSVALAAPPQPRALPAPTEVCDGVWLGELLDELTRPAPPPAPEREPLRVISIHGSARPAPPPRPPRPKYVPARVRYRVEMTLASVAQACELPPLLARLPEELLAAPPDSRDLAIAKTLASLSGLTLLGKACLAPAGALQRAYQLAPNQQAAAFARSCKLSQAKLATAKELRGLKLSDVVVATTLWTFLKQHAPKQARRVFRLVAGVR